MLGYSCRRLGYWHQYIIIIFWVFLFTFENRLIPCLLWKINLIQERNNSTNYIENRLIEGNILQIRYLKIQTDDARIFIIFGTKFVLILYYFNKLEDNGKVVVFHRVNLIIILTADSYGVIIIKNIFSKCCFCIKIYKCILHYYIFNQHCIIISGIHYRGDKMLVHRLRSKI